MSQGGAGLDKERLTALREVLLEFALALPGAHLDHPWGEDVAKVRGKVFVFLGNGDPTHGFLMTAKLPESGAGILMHDFAQPAGYGLGKSGWVSIRHDHGELPPAEVLADWIEESYRVVAPKKLVGELDAEREQA